MMHELEPRLLVLEKKYAALEKRLAEVEARLRVREAQAEADIECDAVLSDPTKSKRDSFIAIVKGAMRMLMAGAPVAEANAAYEAITANLDAQVHLALDATIGTMMGSAESSRTPRENENVRGLLTQASALASEHGITFRELNLPRP